MLEKHEHENTPHDLDSAIEMRENPAPSYFSILLFGLVIWGVAFIAYFLFSGWSSEKEFQKEMAAHQREHAVESGAQPSGGGGEAPVAAAATASTGSESNLEEGKKLFASNCAVCHGPEGKGGIGPDLTSETFKYGRSVEAITDSITNGRPGGMPAFGNQLSGEKVSSLARFVESL